MFNRAMTLGVSCVLVSACVASEAEEDGVDLSETDQAFTGNWNYSWGDTKFSTADLGSAVGRTCFMSGVAGYLTVNNFPEGDSQAGAGVYVDANNHYRIFVDPAFEATLQTWVRCVNVSGTTEQTWRAGQPKKLLGAVTANRRCFITKLTTGRDGSFPHGAFNTTSDNVWVTNDGSNWYIDGNVFGLVWVSARCIDVTQDLGQFWGYSIPGNTSVWPLVQATNGATCGLTQVSGQLNSPNDWVAGPYVSYNAGYNFFDFNTKDGTGGRVRCVR